MSNALTPTEREKVIDEIIADLRTLRDIRQLKKEQEEIKSKTETADINNLPPLTSDELIDMVESLDSLNRTYSKQFTDFLEYCNNNAEFALNAAFTLGLKFGAKSKKTKKKNVQTP